jgi:hypothetical protein
VLDFVPQKFFAWFSRTNRRSVDSMDGSSLRVSIKMTRRKRTRLKGASLSSLAQPHAPAAIDELARIMTRSKNDTARALAAKTLLDRAYGRLPQALSLATKDDVLLSKKRSKMTPEEQAAYYNELRLRPARYSGDR